MNEVVSQGVECQSIPVRKLQHIQSFGLLIALDEQSKVITHVSENIQDHFKIPPTDFLGKKLDDFVSTPEVKELMDVLNKGPSEKAFGWEPSFEDKKKEILIHRVEPYLIIEWIPIPENTQRGEEIDHKISLLLTSFEKFHSLPEFLGYFVQQMRQVLQFDKVLVYQYSQDFSGVTVAEDKVEEMDQYLGLTFPESDLPKQVRELFFEYPLRIITNSKSLPVGIISKTKDHTLDLSKCLLKGVVPVHQQYTQNMKIEASISYAIRHDNKLWGLLCCHNRAGKLLDYKERLALSLFAHVTQSAIVFYEEKEASDFDQKAKKIFKQFSEASANTHENFHEILIGKYHDLFNLLRTTGMSLIFENKIYRLGDTPPEDVIQRLMTWVSQREKNQMFYRSDNLSKDWEEGNHHLATAAGCVVLRLMEDSMDGLIFFRREQVKSIEWAGEKKESEGNKALNPRESFSSWKEEVKGCSEPYELNEIEMMQQLQAHVQRALLRQKFVKEKLSEREIYQITLAAKIANEGVVILTHDLKCHWYNDCFARFFKMDEQKEEKDFFQILEKMNTDLGFKEKNPIKPDQDWKQEIVLEDPEGQKFYHCKMNPMSLGEGQKMCYVGVIGDVTELRKAQEELSQLNKQKDDIMRMASHDIRNPLSVVVATSSILLENQGLNEEAKQMVTTISEQGQVVITMLNELLNTALIESGQFQIHPENLDLKAFFDENTKFNDLLAKKKEITIKREFQLEVQSGGVDKSKLKQVVDNFLSNAIKYSNPKSEITLRVYTKPGELKVEVQDHGPGIPQEEHGKVFKQGERLSTKPTAGESSHGVGLSICKQLVQAMRGQVGFHSEKDKGSTFYFTLPLVDAPSQKSAEQAPTNNQPNTASPKKGPLQKILVIDDDEQVMNLAKQSLSKISGVTIEGAKTGDEALEKAPQFGPNLILLDVNLPGMDGPTILSKLREREELKKTEFIFLSGASDEATLSNLRQMNVLEIISKPFDFKALPDQIQKIWNK